MDNGHMNCEEKIINLGKLLWGTPLILNLEFQMILLGFRIILLTIVDT